MESKTVENKTVNESVDRNWEMLFAAVMPNTKFFESRFDILDKRVGSLEKGQEELKGQLRHFEKSVDSRFLQMDVRFSEFKQDMRDRFVQVDERFGQVDKCFEQVDKRFEQVDKRFEQVDKRFEQVDESLVRIAESIERMGDNLNNRIDNLSNGLDSKIENLSNRLDSRIENLGNKLDLRDDKQRGFTIRMFSIAISIFFVGAGGIFLKLFQVI